MFLCLFTRFSLYNIPKPSTFVYLNFPNSYILTHFFPPKSVKVLIGFDLIIFFIKKTL